jgi:hypothetical protein
MGEAVLNLTDLVGDMGLAQVDRGLLPGAGFGHARNGEASHNRPG